MKSADKQWFGNSIFMKFEAFPYEKPKNRLIMNIKIILIGYMGSGKTLVGKSLAIKLNLPFKDLDEEIEKVEGISIPDIFSQKGEIYFRKLENQVLKKLLLLDKGFVLATGGGTPCYADSLPAMLNTQNASTVYLKTPIHVLCDRLIKEKENRPLLAHLKTREEMLEFVGIHLFERSHFYNQAQIIVSTDESSAEEIASEIASEIAKPLL